MACPKPAYDMTLVCTRCHDRTLDSCLVSQSFLRARLDAQVPGTVLLRNPEGYVYFLNLNIQQVCGAGCPLDRKFFPPQSTVLGPVEKEYFELRQSHGQDS
eukprot:scaffold46607_cov18-Tisochrysis_lutea.AAC.1